MGGHSGPGPPNLVETTRSGQPLQSTRFVSVAVEANTVDVPSRHPPGPTPRSVVVNLNGHSIPPWETTREAEAKKTAVRVGICILMVDLRRIFFQCRRMILKEFG